VQIFSSTTRVPPAAASTKSSTREPQGLHLLLTRVRSDLSRQARGSLIAFTAPNPGAGVSHVVRFFAEKLAVQTRRRTLVVDAPRLRELDFAGVMNTPGPFAQTSVPNLWSLPTRVDPSTGETLLQEATWQDESEWGLSPLPALTASFSYTLIDCPSLGTSYDAELLAPEVDGIVLVVEADKTKRAEILRARRTIEMANGKLMALVLNKRRHVVPGWLYRML